MNAFEVVQPRPVRGGWSLRGYKGKGGGGGARQPVEAADSLHSTSYARVLDLLSEGEIAGLVNGLQSIYLNNTPLQNVDGSFNFAGVTADFRAGFQTQDPIPGFPSAESPVAVGVELKAATPWVRSILNRNLSAVRVTLGVDGLSKANTENGDISGYTVNYAIDLQTDGGAWVQVLAAAFTGKTTQQYRRTHRIDLPTAVTNWTLRVRRVTPNANSNTVADTTVIESITEVIDAKLRYPMSALVGLQVDASQFRDSVPTRAYHCRGRIIRVPSNYDPVMRTYAGIWDGTFKSAYSNNPAWVFYDLATNDRYGLGKRIPAGWINKWSLYQIGVYCDGMVSNGRGGVEPRFTCNAYLQSRGDATRVLQDLCSIFRGMVYWAAGAAVPVADMPRDPAVTYNQGDVIDGRFSYSGSRLKDRHTVALVSYNDMTDFGRQKVVYYQDDAAVARYGIRKVEISAFGCTSEAQALRVGQWAVLTAQRETRSVSFSLGLKGNLCSPGQVIEIADSAFAGRRMGGLVKSATAAKVALDAPVTAQAGDSITVMLPSGVAQSRRIAFLEMIGGTQHVSVNPAFDAAPVAESSWAISTADVATQLFTVLSVTEGTGPGLTFDVSAIQHEPGKFASIDQGALLPERPVSVVPAQVLPTPIGVTVGAHSVTAADGTVSTTVTASWRAVAGAAFYDVEWSRSQSDWVRMPRTALTAVDVPNAYTGDYLVRVRAISAIDTVSAWGYSAATPVAAKASPPRNYDTFMVSEADSGMRQYSFAYTTQRPPADLAGAEIRYILGSPVNIDWQQMRPLDDGGYYTNSFESTKPEAGLWTFALRARSRSGVLSEGMLIWRGQLLHNVADVAPDLTPPPTPTGFAAMAALTTATLQTDLPSYEMGHGHATTNFYVAEVTTATPNPAFGAARLAVASPEHVATAAVELGKTYRFWAKWKTLDGVESEQPSAPVTLTVGKVGNSDLGDLIVEAGNLADGAVNASKLAEKAVDATKFASGIEPVGIVSGGSLPTVKTTSTVVFGGKLYRWNGTAYTAAVPTADLTGQISSAQLADNAVTVSKIAAGAVDAGKIAAGAVGETHLANLAVTAAKVADNAVTVSKIADCAVQAGKIAAGAVGETHLANLAVTAAKVADNAVTVSKIADGAVQAGKIAAGAVRETHLANLAVTAAKVADNAVTVSKIADGAVQAGKLASNAVTADKIAASAVDATKFASGIEPVGIVSGATLPTVKTTSAIVFGGKLYRWNGTVYTVATAAGDVTGQLTDAQLAAISASKLTGQITGTQITDGAISTPKIAAGAVSASQIAAGAVTAGKIAANAVTATEIAAGAITAGKIAANAVTANEIATNAVTTAKIAAGAVTTGELAAGAVTANKLVVTSTDTVNVDPFFQDADLWSYANFTRKNVAGSPGPFVLSATVNANLLSFGTRTPIDTSKTYLFETWYLALAATPNRGFATIRFYDINGNELKSADAPALNWPGYNSSSGNYYFPAVTGAGTATSWTRHTVTVGPEGSAGFPPKAAYFAVGTFLNYSGAAPVVEMLWGGVRVVEMSRGELIVDGAITAAKIAAKTITAAEIAAGSITSTELGANSVTAGKIAANAVTATQIAAGTITAAEIASGAITAVKIAAKAITAAQIAANAITATELAANSVTTAKIAANAVTATQIAAGTITAAEIASGTITADKIAAKAITAAQISAGAITATELAANSVTTAKIAANAVTATQIAAGTITAAEIASGAITTAKIAANAITAAQIAAGTITAAELGAGSVTTAKVAAGAITATEIATNAITAVKIAASAVTTDKIATNAVTANEIAANAITTAKIAAGAVNAAQIAAGAITATKMTLTDTSNIFPDPDLADPDFYSGDGPYTIPTASGAGYGFRYLNLTGTASSSTNTEVVSGWFQMETAREFSVALVANVSVANAGIACSVYLELGSVSTAGVVTATRRLAIREDYTGTSSAALTVTLGPTTTAEKRARLVFVRKVTTPATATARFSAVVIRRAVSAELIVDGAIVAAKLSANAIAVGTAAIQNGAIVNAMIGNLAADKITAGTLAAARIAAGSIDATKLAALAVTAGKIAANAVTATEIAAGAITAAKLSAGAVTADKISVATLSAVAANMGTLTAGRIQNAANTTFIDLNATGSTQAIKFGNDLSYSESGGLVINRLSVIGTNQLAPNSVSEQNYVAMPSEVELFQNDNFTQYWQVSLPPGQTSLVVNSGSYQLNSWGPNLEGYKLEILVRAWGAGSNYKDLGYLVLDERPANGSNAPPPSWFTFPLGMVNSDVYPNVIFYYRSIGKNLVTSMTRKINFMNMEILSIKR
ncbi:MULTISPECIES: phage tail protein [Comamonas]|uniref:TipJ family phage tail tip protein n=1 Tax=Comamonas TaxID=283 RepID=UPI0001DA6985|nr:MULTISPECIES: phage tail protein [Comamonas]EFI62635.1 bacteriophage protein [Comamonas thiooxydans]